MSAPPPARRCRSAERLPLSARTWGQLRPASLPKHQRNPHGDLAETPLRALAELHKHPGSLRGLLFLYHADGPGSPARSPTRRAAAAGTAPAHPGPAPAESAHRPGPPAAPRDPAPRRGAPGLSPGCPPHTCRAPAPPALPGRRSGRTCWRRWPRRLPRCPRMQERAGLGCPGMGRAGRSGTASAPLPAPPAGFRCRQPRVRCAAALPGAAGAAVRRVGPAGAILGRLSCSQGHCRDHLPANILTKTPGFESLGFIKVSQ